MSSVLTTICMSHHIFWVSLHIFWVLYFSLLLLSHDFCLKCQTGIISYMFTWQYGIPRLQPKLHIAALPFLNCTSSALSVLEVSHTDRTRNLNCRLVFNWWPCVIPYRKCIFARMNISKVYIWKYFTKNNHFLRFQEKKIIKTSQPRH